jgi:hypothetical protein
VRADRAAEDLAVAAEAGRRMTIDEAVAFARA